MVPLDHRVLREVDFVVFIIFVALKIILLLLGGFRPRVENIYSPTPDSRRASILNVPRTRGK